MEYVATIGISMIVIATLLVIFMALIRVISWSPLQKAEQNLTPRVMEMLTKDRQLRFIDLWMVFFLIATFLIVLDMTSIGTFSKTSLMIIWFFGLGGSLDVLHHMMKRII